MPEADWDELTKEVPPVCARWPDCEAPALADNNLTWGCTWPSCAEE